SDSGSGIGDRSEIQVEPVQRVIGDIPELADERLGTVGRVAPEALAPQGVGAGPQGVVGRVGGRAELAPGGGAPQIVHSPLLLFPPVVSLTQGAQVVDLARMVEVVLDQLPCGAETPAFGRGEEAALPRSTRLFTRCTV